MMTYYDRISEKLVVNKDSDHVTCSTLLCYAIVFSDIPSEAKRELSKRIGEGLGHCGTVSSWLIHHGYVPRLYREGKDRYFWYEQMQLYRRRWLKHLLEELGYE